jgi:Ca2+-binding EF-hand superfamily protein
VWRDLDTDGDGRITADDLLAALGLPASSPTSSTNATSSPAPADGVAAASRDARRAEGRSCHASEIDLEEEIVTSYVVDKLAASAAAARRKPESFVQRLQQRVAMGHEGEAGGAGEGGGVSLDEEMVGAVHELVDSWGSIERGSAQPTLGYAPPTTPTCLTQDPSCFARRFPSHRHRHITSCGHSRIPHRHNTPYQLIPSLSPPRRYEEVRTLLRVNKRIKLAHTLREGAVSYDLCARNRCAALRTDVFERRNLRTIVDIDDLRMMLLENAGKVHATLHGPLWCTRIPTPLEDAMLPTHTLRTSCPYFGARAHSAPVGVHDNLRRRSAPISHPALPLSQIIDVLKTLDKDGDGTVTKEEFRACLPLLGFDASDSETIDAIFDEIDLDGSGALDYDELRASLRQGAHVAIDEVLREGAVAFETSAKNAIATRVDVNERRHVGRALTSIDDLRAEMQSSCTRLIDVLRTLDTDGDGTVTQAEFRAALPLLGFDASDTSVVDALFVQLDA